MYCPKCAAPIEGGKFCRACGANVSLIPQALTGRLASSEPTVAGKSGKSPSVEAAASSFFSGIGLFIASFAVLSFAPAGRIWWFWLLIPAFASLGRGVGEYLRYRDQQRTRKVVDAPVVPAGNEAALPPVSSTPVTGSIPGSVIEETTRHLDPAARGEKSA
ncbi:MAG: zinc ribbon domain-containing protein [Acidobacteriota bacterium]